MYNIQHTISQQYIFTSKNSKNISSIKTIKHLLTNNTNTLVNKKTFKIYPTTDLSYTFYTTQLNSIDSKNIIKCYIKITLNNIFVTYIYNSKIKTISLASLGFKGKSKQTAYALKTFAETLTTEFLTLNQNSSLLINIYAQSLNHKLKTFLKIFKSNNLQINKIYDITPIPYNGCRKKKISIKKKKKSIIKFLYYS